MDENIFNLKMSDGVNIAVRTWCDPKKEGLAIVIVFHGMGGHGGYYRYLADCMVQHGLLILSPDLRGHGQSEGRRGDLKMRDVLADINQLLHCFKSMYPDKPIFLMGESMGGSVAINFLNNYANDSMSLQGIILFSPGLVRRSDYMSLYLYLFVFLAYLIIPGLPVIRLDDDKDDLRVKRYSTRYLYELFKYGKKAASASLEGINIPLIIFHGDNDHVINVETVKNW